MLTESILSIPGTGLGDATYEVHFTWEVTGNESLGTPKEIDPRRLIATWHETIDRHPVLRTVLLEVTAVVEAGILHQVVLKKYSPECVLLHAEDAGEARKLLASTHSYKTDGVFLDKKPPHMFAICTT
ncbi:hypothetical protein F5X99DRAFT_413194 [Biscogniauxia marginata]|nr:hypothetical protein F5X99DRAFT_413194 [Biscogniauxia marginata]